MSSTFTTKKKNWYQKVEYLKWILILIFLFNTFTKTTKFLLLLKKELKMRVFQRVGSPFIMINKLIPENIFLMLIYHIWLMTKTIFVIYRIFFYYYYFFYFYFYFHFLYVFKFRANVIGKILVFVFDFINLFKNIGSYRIAFYISGYNCKN